MNIVILTNIPTPYRTAFFNKLSAELEENCMSLTVLYCAKTEPRRHWKFLDSEQRYNYKFLSGKTVEIKSTYLHLNFEVLKVLRFLRPSHLILAGAWNTPTMLLALYGYKKECIKLFWSEGHKSAERHSNFVVRLFRRLIYQKFDAYLVPNNTSKMYVLELIRDSAGKVGFLPNTIDENFYSVNSIDEITNLRRKYNLSMNARCIVLVATLTHRKGIMEFVRVYATIKKKLTHQYNIIIVGTGDDRIKISEFIKDKGLIEVKLLGHLDKREVRELLKLSDVFALPTRLDPNPLTPIEACFMQTPLLLSRWAGNYEELLNPKTGIGIDEISESAIAKSILELDVRSLTELKNMGIEAYNNVNENFRREKVVTNLVNYLSSL